MEKDASLDKFFIPSPFMVYEYMSIYVNKLATILIYHDSLL